MVDHGHVEREPAVGQIERQGAHAAAVHGEQVDDELVLVELHAAAHAGRLRQGAGHLAAGGVAAGVHHAAHRVRALAAEHDLAVDAVEARADLHELAHAVRALADQHAHGLRVAQAGAGVDRVLEVQLGRVGLAEGGGDAALGEEGRGVVRGWPWSAARRASGARRPMAAVRPAIPPPSTSTSKLAAHAAAASGGWRCRDAAWPCRQPPATAQRSPACGPTSGRWRARCHRSISPPRRTALTAWPLGAAWRRAPRRRRPACRAPATRSPASGTSTNARAAMRGCGSVSSGSSDSTS